MSNITDKSVIIIPVTQDINNTEVDNLEIEQSEQGNNQQSDNEAEEQHDGVVETLRNKDGIEEDNVSDNAT